MPDFKYNFVDFTNSAMALNDQDWARITSANTSDNLTMNLSSMVEGDFCIVQNYQSNANSVKSVKVLNGTIIDSETIDMPVVYLRRGEQAQFTCLDSATQRFLYTV
jgi:hypothetical protein